MPNTAQPLVGIFDSGVGGLSVLREVRALLPAAPLYYIADQAHVPYGRRGLEEIRRFSLAIARFLEAQGAGLVVVACNTASAAALRELRAAMPAMPFVGMEPAVKPASRQTANGVVGVLATPATFQGRLYASLVERFAKDVTLLTDTLPGLVEAVERGELDTPATRVILEAAIRPMLAQGADTLVLGCTHFPFVLPLIREIAEPDVHIIDPAPAVARRVAALLEAAPAQPVLDAKPAITFATSGDPAAFARILRQLLGQAAQPQALRWDDAENQILLPKEPA